MSRIKDIDIRKLPLYGEGRKPPVWIGDQELTDGDRTIRLPFQRQAICLLPGGDTSTLR